MIRLTSTIDCGVARRALEVNGHLIELRALLRHPWAGLALIFGWLTASRDDGGSV